MLARLAVTGYATIEHLEVDLSTGASVLTGETGAGKSIIVGALGLLLGGRADAAVVRSGARQARVEGVFAPGAESLQRIESALDGAVELGGELVLAREINAEGRNVCRINGQMVPLRLLSRAGEHLVDIHGQGEHLSLLRVREHVDLLDRYAGLGELRDEVGSAVGRLRAVQRELSRLRENERELARRMDLLRFQVEEIGAARLRPGEEEELELERTQGANAERLAGGAEEAYRVLYEGEGREASASDLLGQAARRLGELARVDPSLEQWRALAEDLGSQTEDLARSLRSYREGVDYTPERLQEVEERLELVGRLKRKYGDSVEEVLRFGEEAQRELDGLAHGEERAKELETEEAELVERVGEVAGRLSRARQEAARVLGGRVERELADLSMPRARVVVEVSQSESESGVPVPSAGADGAGRRRLGFDATGVDHVEFLVSANPGEPPRPVAKAASGGEMARLMLAIKVALAEADRVPTLVFDEVDAGIGGRVGGVVGRKLWELAGSHQVLCVTHLPQMACFADRHLRVAKGLVGERSVTSVDGVTGEARVEEIGQMLGATGQATRRNAREMLEHAEEAKSSR